MSNITILYVGNDNLLDLEALRDELTGEYLTTGTVEVTLRDEDGIEVGGDVWPKPMPFVAGSHGVYRVTLPYTLTLVAGRRYTADIVADAGPGQHAAFTVELVARARK